MGILVQLPQTGSVEKHIFTNMINFEAVLQIVFCVYILLVMTFKEMYSNPILSFLKS